MNQPDALSTAQAGRIEQLRLSLLACAANRIRSVILYGSRATGQALGGQPL
jgi:hypothetical protein